MTLRRCTYDFVAWTGIEEAGLARPQRPGAQPDTSGHFPQPLGGQPDPESGRTKPVLVSVANPAATISGSRPVRRTTSGAPVAPERTAARIAASGDCEPAGPGSVRFM